MSDQPRPGAPISPLPARTKMRLHMLVRAMLGNIGPSIVALSFEDAESERIRLQVRVREADDDTAEQIDDIVFELSAQVGPEVSIELSVVDVARKSPPPELPVRLFARRSSAGR